MGAGGLCCYARLSFELPIKFKNKFLYMFQTVHVKDVRMFHV